MSDPIRIMVFDERPDCIVLYIPCGTGNTVLPALSHPLTKERVGAALRQAGLDYRITIGTPGQWFTSSKKLYNAAQAERNQRENLDMAVKKAQARGATSLVVESRIEALQRKNLVDEELRKLKTQLGRAKGTAFETGRYLPATQYRNLERRVEELKQESQALQTKISELRRQEHEELDAEWKRTSALRRSSYAEKFLSVAKDILPEEVLQRIHGLASGQEDDREDSARP